LFQQQIASQGGHLQVSPSTLQGLISCYGRLTPDMLLHLSRVLGRSAESWLIGLGRS
jgi:plasmid maintenance system antidote protein VapI